MQCERDNGSESGALDSLFPHRLEDPTCGSALEAIFRWLSLQAAIVLKLRSGRTGAPVHWCGYELPLLQNH